MLSLFRREALAAIALGVVGLGGHNHFLSAPFAGQWAVEGGQLQENPEPCSVRKVVDVGLPSKVDSHKFRCLLPLESA
jgi:hypothetical protein